MLAANASKSMKRKSKFVTYTPRFAAIAMLASALFSSPGLAQEQVASSEEKKPKRGNRLMEEVIVVAQKRSENAQDVPIALAAFSNEKLDAMGIDDAKDLAQFTPGMYYGQTVNFAVIYIRGVGSDAFLPDSDPSVATYIDGIYYPFANGQSQAFGAVERIEVLKGPQGTLFGRNSTGGAINIITKSPGDVTEVSLQASYERFDTLSRRVHLSAPVNDQLAFSFSYTATDAENYYDCTRGDGNGGFETCPDEQSEGYRYKMRLTPRDDMELNLAYIKFDQYGVSSTAMPNVAPSLLSQVQGIQAAEDDYEVKVNVPSYFSLDNDVFYGQFVWNTDWFDLKLLGSWQEIVTDNVYDFDGSEQPFILFDAKGQFADVKTQEIQIVSNENSPAWLDWIVGAFHINQEAGFPINSLGAAGLDTLISDVTSLFPPGAQDAIDAFLATIGAPNGSVALVSLQAAESKAYFAQTTIRMFDDVLALTLGGRYQEETRKVIESSSNLLNADGSFTEIQSYRGTSNDDNNFSPKVSLAYTPWDDVMFYASYTQGFKSGTYNTVNVYDPPEFVEAETVTTYELGLKSQFFDRALTFNAAIFENTIDNLQVQFISLLSGGAVSLENAGGAKIKGVDMDLQWVPLPNLNPNMVLALSGSYLDSEYTEYEDGSGYNEGDGLYNGGTGNFTGNRVTRTPEFSGSFGVNQLINLGDFGELELNSTVYYNDGFFFLAQNSDISWEENYYIVDASVSLLHFGSNVRLTAFGKNLNGAKYNYSQFHTDAGRSDYLAPPTSFGLRVAWDWADE